MKKSSVLNSPRLLELKKKKHKVLRRKIFFLVALLILILVGVSFLFKWQKINIDSIDISGNKLVDTKAIEDIVGRKISGDYLWIFPKTNFIFYPKGEIVKELNNSFKRINNISLNIKDFRTLQISIEERVGLYTYCGNIFPEKLADDKCYFMDDTGYIFSEAPYFSGEIYLKFYGTVATDSDSPIGFHFFEPYFYKVISFKDTLEKIGMKPVIFYFDDDKDIRMFISPFSSIETGPEIIWKADANYGEVIENLQTVLTTELLQSDSDNKYSSILYIDLRFGNKVYYKLK